MNADGQRYVGDNIGTFEGADLAFIGPNQPHSWVVEGRPAGAGPIQTVVVWFTGDWLNAVTQTWPELLVLEALRERASRGLRFTPAVIKAIAPQMLALRLLQPARRLPQLLNILVRLAEDRGARSLASHAGATEGNLAQQRMSLVLEKIHADLRDVPTVSELAKTACMSTGAFHRWFKRHTGLTVIQYVLQLRIGAACQELISTERAVNAIASAAGFRSLAHFNRQFLSSRGVTPSQFRTSYRTARPPDQAQSDFGD